MPEIDHIEGLLFDLGGVIIEIDFAQALTTWQQWTSLPTETLRRRLTTDEAYRQLERGEISSMQYFDHLRTLLELDAEDEQIAQGWNAIFIGEITETVNYITTAAHHLPCFLLSNSNPVHQDFWMREYHDALKPFQQIYVSSDIGARKPDRLAFEIIAESTGIEPAAMLFFDDTMENIEGALAFGMPAVHVTSHRDVGHALHHPDLL